MPGLSRDCYKCSPPHSFFEQGEGMEGFIGMLVDSKLTACKAM